MTKQFTRENLHEFFNGVDKMPLQAERLVMNDEDAVDYGIANRCNKCGEIYLKVHTHTPEECDNFIVRQITES